LFFKGKRDFYGIVQTLSACSTGFVIIAFASKQIGSFLKRFKLLLISGFLFTGIIAGPYVLGLIQVEAIENLRFIDEIALAVIAFAASNELYIKELRDRMKSITWVTAGLVLSTFTLGSLTLIFLSAKSPRLLHDPALFATLTDSNWTLKKLLFPSLSPLVK
jgi:NhaP-type Na+/H+ or K+/H+ antiporter